MPRIGIIVEGNGEVPAFKHLIPKLSCTSEILGQPVRADMQPKGTPAQVATSAKAAVAYFKGRQVDVVLVLIDKEDHPSAPGLAATLRAAFDARYPGVAFEVVVKNSCIENWLVADLDALRAQPKRFRVTNAEVRKIMPNKADSIDAQNLLNKMAIKFEYDKGADPARIAANQDPRRAAAHSRSFRRFLRVVGDPTYSTQSKRPAPAA
jgi:hypothetical protein